MPKQYVLFGRLLPPITMRRITFLLSAVFIFAVFSVIITLPSAVPTGPSLSKFADHKFSIPQFSGRSKWSNKWASSLNPFRAKSHAPQRQKNDSHEGSSWFADWKWLSTPFSSSFTLDENRALLPPLPERPAIYCYYDTTVERDKATMDAESALLLTWRRAWWAQGFRPVILSAAEATNNPRYEELLRLPVAPAVKTDIMRWLAWESMGGGLLAHYLLLPMGPREDDLLTYLRRGEYPMLTRWKNLGDGLFAGTLEEVANALKLILANPSLSKAQNFLEAVPPPDPTDKDDGNDLKKKTKDYPFHVDEPATSLALYDAPTISKLYPKVADAITKGRAAGLIGLSRLINAHLHIAWQNYFSNGIAVLKPQAEHMTHLVAPAVELAKRLAQCSVTPLEASCPPNLPKCSPCVASTPMVIHTPPTYRNTSTLYTIGTVPHPFTFQYLAYKQSPLSIRWLRRESRRDGWLFDITKELSGTGVSGGARILRLKQAMASEYGRAHSLWMVAEHPVQVDLDWWFGFVVPALGGGLDKGESPTPVPGPERLPPVKQDKDDGPLASPEKLVLERGLFEKAKQLGQSREPQEVAMRDAVEAWNLADTEVWKFARAYMAQAFLERTTWEKEEAQYAKGVGSEKGRRGSFWE